jgi:outer membrane protein, heavy metal efflux system
MNKILRNKLLILSFLLFSYSIIVDAKDNTDMKLQNNNHSGDTITISEMNKNEAPLDLNWLIREALEQNPEIIAAQKRSNAAKMRIPQAKSLDDPVFRAGSFDMSRHPFNINNQTPMLQQRYAVSQSIPFPGKLHLRGEVAAEESNIVNQEFQAKIQEIIALVKNAFYEFHYVERAIEITEENRELLHKFAKIAETKYKVGKTTQRDVLAAQVEVSILTNNLIVLNEQRESIIARINALLDRPIETALGKPRNFEKHTFDLTIKELETLALENRPELKGFEHAIKRNEADLKLSKKDYYYTDFEPMVEYMQEDGTSDTWASAITINIPWLWPKNRSKVKESKENLYAAESDYRFVFDKTLFELKDFLVKIRSTESTINLYKARVIPDARQSLESARIGYESDRVDFLALIDSERLLLDSTLLYYRALTDFEQNLVNLERTIGVQLTK